MAYGRGQGGAAAARARKPAPAPKPKPTPTIARSPAHTGATAPARPVSRETPRDTSGQRQTRTPATGLAPSRSPLAGLRHPAQPKAPHVTSTPDATLRQEPTVLPIQRLLNPNADRQVRGARHQQYLAERPYLGNIATAPLSTGVGMRRVAAGARDEQAHFDAAERQRRQPTIDRHGHVTFKDPLRQAALEAEQGREPLFNRGSVIEDRSGALQGDAIEIAHQIAGMSDADLKKFLNWKPSDVQTAGASLNFQSPAGFIKGLGTLGAIAGQAGPAVLGHNILGNAASDAIQFPLQSATAGYQLGDAALHPGTKGLDFLKGTAQQIEHPWESFKKHPLFTASLFRGGLAVAGRVTGAGARLAGGNAVDATGVRAALGNRNRQALNVNGVPYARSYSRDAIVKQGQVLADTLRRKRHGEGPVADIYGVKKPTLNVNPNPKIKIPALNNRMSNAQGDLEYAKSVASQHATGKREASAVHEHAPVRGTKLKRIQQTLASQPLHMRLAKLLPKAIRNIAYRPERDAVSLALRGITRNPEKFWHDIATEQSRVQAQLHADRVATNGAGKIYKHPGERDQAQEYADTLQRLIDAKKHVDVNGIFESRDQLAPILNELEQRSEHAGILPGGSIRAKYFEYAQKHMGARYGDHAPPREVSARRGVLKATVSAAHRAHGAARKATEDQAKVVRAAHDKLTAAKAQAQELSRRVGGEKAGAAARRKGSPVYAAGSHGVQAAERGLAKAEKKAAALAEAHSYARDVLDEARATLKRDRGPVRGSLRSASGGVLTNDAIEAHMIANGVDPAKIGFLPNHLRLRDGRAYYQGANGIRKNIAVGHKTGHSFDIGALPHSWEHLMEHVIGRSNVLDSVHHHDNFINQVGRKGADGEYLSGAEADHIANNGGVGSDGTYYGPDMIGMRAFNSKDHFAPSVEGLQAQTKNLDLHSALVHHDFASRMDMMHGDTNAKNVVMVPRQLAERYLEHAEKSSRPTAAVIDSAFRRAVLPLSTKWIFGNVFEAALRSAVAGVNPLTDPRAATRVFRTALEMDAKAVNGEKGIAAADALRSARTLRAKVPFTGSRQRYLDAARNLERLAPNAVAIRNHIVGGQIFGNRGLTVHVAPGKTILGDFGAQVSHAPVVKELNSTLKTLTSQSFKLNSWAERSFQKAAFGKHMRQQMQEFGTSWHDTVRLQQEAVDQASKGMLNTPEQVKAAQAVHEMLGKYSGFGPATRKLIQGYAPFLPWYLNSARFVAHTLPARYPVTTAILTQAERQFADDWKRQHADVPPGDLKTAIPYHGGFVDAARFTPFGFPGPIAGGDWASVAGIVTPQASDILHGLQGKDAFGSDLKDKQGNKLHGWSLLRYMISQGAESTIPTVSAIRRLQEGGGTSAGTSTALGPQTKPGTAKGFTSALDKVYNPLHVTRLKGKGGATLPKASPGSFKVPGLKTQGFKAPTFKVPGG